MIIRSATIDGNTPVDLRIRAGQVVQIGEIATQEGEPVLDAEGGLLLPGLHDHHIHMAACARQRESVDCSPAVVRSARDLSRQLALHGTGFLRGTGYDESSAGLLDRHQLDAIAPHRPVRIQHRTGRMWFLNTLAVQQLLASGLPPPEGLERAKGGWTGRLFEADDWLRLALRGQFPDLAPIAQELARSGVTGLTDMGPQNDDAVAQHFYQQHKTLQVPQRIVLGGVLTLGPEMPRGVRRGPAKLHLHEAQLPALDGVEHFIRQAHAQERPVAIHCVTETELVFALAAVRAAGACPGDRIEHASVTTPELVAQIADLGLVVVAQPHFILGRGDSYVRDIPRTEWPHLYRLRSFLQAGVRLCGGSDGPYGSINPWEAMAAAVSRKTCKGEIIGADEALTPEEALDLYLADPDDLSRKRHIHTGMTADLCLLHQPWQAARTRLSASLVRATLIGGRIIHESVNKPERERLTS